MGSDCENKIKGKQIITIMDTTEINCDQKNNRVVKEEGLGFLSDNKTKGFHLHPGYCLDANTLEPLGIAGARIIARQEGGSLKAKELRDITEKESDKWFSEPKKLRDSVLKEAAHNVFVFDCEADIYEVLSEISNDRTDLVIRGRFDRKVINDDPRRKTIADQFRGVKTKRKIEFYKRHKDGKKEKIKAWVKYTRVSLLKPQKDKKYIENIKPSIELNVVEVKQIGTKNNSEKIRWVLLTTMEVNSFEQAFEIVNIYKSRWKIEELFRVMKKEGFDIESSELESGKSIRKLSLFIMEAALKVEQLKLARDGDSNIKTEDVFDKEETKLLELLNKAYEGATEKQKNPYEKENLAWASWIIARMGGWKGYQSQRPPGPITFFRGLQSFQTAFFTYRLTKE